MKNSFDIVILLGDRYELLAASIAALFAKIPIAHISGGETTVGAFDEAIRALRCGKMDDAAKAAHIMLYGRYAKYFWMGIGLAVLSVGCALWGEPIVTVGVFAGLTSLASLAFYEHAWNLAGQAPPLS